MNIGIIDDNKDQRETLKLALEAHLEDKESSLGVLDIFPFVTESFDEYFSWIEENEIICLIFDERMHNESEEDKGPVDYRGNELVTIIRNKFKEIPIYVITSHKGDPDLQAKFSYFEDIIDRQEFIDEGEKYVDRFIRASQRFLEENSQELNEFQELSELIASGKASKEDNERLKALQVKLDLPLNQELGERSDWLDEYESMISSLESLKEEIESKISNK
ncbi:hypothetical protein [Pseudofulvibacter geojedonensis]|uniref:Response regulatory domain-containing protein n=1 Tax=Pseudofulvibacter geojedonensis TaxID=1123758 RepID=A0ABW3HZ74_9FLAO